MMFADVACLAGTGMKNFVLFIQFDRSKHANNSSRTVTPFVNVARVIRDKEAHSGPLEWSL